ncbi:MAG: hypothetical protein CM15mP17_16170 [Gammaproteobacteria bacterium]|nr:MAG: hypothetical protein CM15mP17_16170 [Gammaproteobacteria bacterium]
MIEIYKDAESHAHHSQTEHFKTLGGALAPFLAGAPEITVHEGNKIVLKENYLRAVSSQENIFR